MTRNDAPKFAELMAAMTENYPKTQLTPMGMKMRFDALQDYSIDQITHSALELMRTHKYNTMPTVGDFVSVIDQKNGKISIEDRAEIEAGDVLTHLRQYGRTKNPQFKDPVTSHLMNSRWIYLSWCKSVKENDLKWWQKDFVRAYKAYAGGVRIGYSLPEGLKIKRII